MSDLPTVSQIIDGLNSDIEKMLGKTNIQSALRMDDDIKMKSELDSLHLTKDFF